jgi:hypothetical protein
MPLITITGASVTEIAEEIWESLDSLINERLYENGVGDDELTTFKEKIISLLMENFEDNL